MRSYFAEGEYSSRVAYEKALRKWWLPLLLMLCGALLGFLIYTGVRAFAGNERMEQVSKFYIDFATDGTGKEADYFNGATWTDLLTAHPHLYEPIVENLKTLGLTEADVSEETFYQYLQNHVKAEILSDVRLLTVTVQGEYRDVVQNTTEAVKAALLSFGETEKEFEQITFLSAASPTWVRPDDRTRNAVLLGAFLGLLDGVLVLWLLAATDDSILVPEEAERQTGLSVLATCFKNGGKKTATVETMERENRENLQRFLTDCEQPAALIHLSGREAGEALLRKLDFLAGKIIVKDREDYEGLRQAKRVLLAVPAGKKNGALLEHVLRELGKQGCPATALLLADADAGILTRVYRVHPAAGEGRGDK